LPGTLAFAANKGVFGSIDLATGQIRTGIQQQDSLLPEFRAVAHTTADFFMLSAGNPALLYKTGDTGSMELVYRESDSLVFYDAMKFWNDREGIAVGDSMDGCLSVIITRDGGRNWDKLPCADLPEAQPGEGAFAASNTNIDIEGKHTWIATTAARIYYSGDQGRTWEVFPTPVISDTPTRGIYSLDFYDESVGIAIGGDYTDPLLDKANKAVTKDGGKTWQLVADGIKPGYKSCVRFVPNTGGSNIVAVGLTGISYSRDTGQHWEEISDEPFYTIRFLNDSIAYAAGRNRIAKVSFR
jgi:photosystem II stability/assembly factor-like uncharacterized protein